MEERNGREKGESSQETTLRPIKERDSSPGSASSDETLGPSTEKSTRRQPADMQNKQLAKPKQKQSLKTSGEHTVPPNKSGPSTPINTRAEFLRQPTETGSFDLHNTLSNRTYSQQHFKQTPSHSLAGPGMMDAQQMQGKTYIDPEYQGLNPRYGKNYEKPIWGLAKPLPRVVRPGMRRDESNIQNAYQPSPAGDAEPAPELGATPGLTSSQSGNDHKSTQDQQTYATAAKQGLPGEKRIYAPQPDGLLRPIESEVNGNGLPSNTDTGQMSTEQQPQEEFLNSWVKIRHQIKEPLAEWLATTIAVFIGLTGTLAVSTGGTQAGNRLSQNWSWGLGSMIGIYIAGGISGAHLNPGISIALWIFRGFPGRRCCSYIIAQTLGAITAAGLAYCLYRDDIIAFSPTASAGTTGLGFYTEPLGHISYATAFFTEFVADAILLCVLFALGDDGNAPPGAGMHSFIIGLVIYVLCICLGFNTGGCLNPVRDFGPRLVALMAGYGGITFTDHQGWWFWGCWMATIGGCLAGACLYDIFVFIGGESPINYAPRRRMRAKLKKEAKWRKRLGFHKDKIPSLEEGIKSLED
ncbi:Glycerol uptake facilitator protein [Penicillium waksmanii]|uniref:Glycerol uptake facilitator protein n=1 Tax=Penicillium waksmanii TaxID=69791 RepID=UPI002548497A|nr:Glycerol uptake facilitator protein [Penicillium waksmanii]KAJ5982853.1 Glycerol uptake facilitator protein [Penicillium waksmanii]